MTTYLTLPFSDNCLLSLVLSCRGGSHTSVFSWERGTQGHEAKSVPKPQENTQVQEAPYCTLTCFGVISLSPPFRSCAFLNTYVTYTWKTMHLMKLRHLDLLRNLGLFSIFKHVRLNFFADFPSGPKPWCPRLPSLVFLPNHRFCLVRRLSAPKPTISSPLPWTFICWHLCGFLNLSNPKLNLAQHLNS
jgi:hypothetical protein